MTKLRYVLLIVMLFPLQSCALYYSAAPIEASVVDAESGKPLEGVIVTANWQLKGGMEGGNDFGQMMVMEAVTDKNGRFYFPAWGPKRNVSDGHIKSDGPQLLLFKSGYRYVVLSNKTSVTDRPGPFLKSDWDGKMIKLEKFNGSMGDYAKHVYDLSKEMDRMLDFAHGDKECEWKNVPRMLVELNRKGAYFENQPLKPDPWHHIMRIEDIPVKAQCGSPKEFLRSYQS